MLASLFPVIKAIVLYVLVCVGVYVACINIYWCMLAPVVDRWREPDAPARRYPSPLGIVGYATVGFLLALDAPLAVFIPVTLLMLVDLGGLHWWPIWIVVMWYRSKKNGRAQ